MSKHNIFLVLLLYYLTYTAKSSTDPNPSPTDFIKAECETTLYPTLCIQSLSTYSTIIQKQPKALHLARAALSLSLSRAQSVSSFVSKMAMMNGLKPMEHRAVRDCAANMASSVDQLRRSMKELGAVGGREQEMGWHESNIESWVGAALTFANTCLDGFRSPIMDGKVKFGITKRVVDCGRVTSISLTLLHRYAASTHKSRAAILP